MQVVHCKGQISAEVNGTNLYQGQWDEYHIGRLVPAAPYARPWSLEDPSLLPVLRAVCAVPQGRGDAARRTILGARSSLEYRLMWGKAF